MTNTEDWSAEETEERLHRMFEMAQTLEGGIEFMDVEFGDQAPTYQFRHGEHNITQMDDKMTKSMGEIIERYNLEINHQEETPDGAVITAAQEQDVTGKDAYTVFQEICKTVYGCEAADATNAYISPVEQAGAIPWTDL